MIPFIVFASVVCVLGYAGVLADKASDRRWRRQHSIEVAEADKARAELAEKRRQARK